MRFFQTFLLAAAAAVAIAQQMQTNYINVPTTGFNAVAGQSITLTWQMPSSSTVTIRLVQGGNTTPGSGLVLASGISAAAQTATFTIPTNVNMAQYNFEIVDDSGVAAPNFSSGFTIAGGSLTTTGTSSGTATSTGTSSASSASSSASSSSSRSSSSMSASLSSASSSISASASSASASLSSATSAAASSATSAPHSNGAQVVGAGSMMAVLAGIIAVF